MAAGESLGSKFMGKAIAVMAIWFVLAGVGYYLLVVLPGRRGSDSPGPVPPDGGAKAASSAAKPGDAAVVEIGVAYGTEKRRWLEPAVEAFAATEAGRRIRVNLLPMGSLEGAHAVLNGNERIHVWSPASSLYRQTFVQEWEVKHSSNPILKEEQLALSPMVFVMWKERYEAFVKAKKTLDFQTIEEALHAEGGWEGIAGKPEWGLFKFGHTHPNESNSGLMTLVLLAYEFHEKTNGLTVADVVHKDFQSRLTRIETGVTGLSNSTGNMMKDMVLKGPASYDVVFVYENVAIDYLKNAEGRWGELHVVYPRRNLWTDNPYYVLNTPWSSQAQQRAAEEFLKFLMSEPQQRAALKHGFHPGDPAISVKTAGSPFVELADYGIQEVTLICEPPSPEVQNNLQQNWQRAFGSRR